LLFFLQNIALISEIQGAFMRIKQKKEQYFSKIRRERQYCAIFFQCLVYNKIMKEI